jgi:hypothetical protein
LQGYLYFNTVLQAKGTDSGKGGDEQGFEDGGNISPSHASRSSSPARAKGPGSRKVSAVHTFTQCPHPQPHVITRSRFVRPTLSHTRGEHDASERAPSHDGATFRVVACFSIFAPSCHFVRVVACFSRFGGAWAPLKACLTCVSTHIATYLLLPCAPSIWPTSDFGEEQVQNVIKHKGFIWHSTYGHQHDDGSSDGRMIGEDFPAFRPGETSRRQLPL